MKTNTVDVESIIQEIQIQSNFKAVYDKALLAGLRVMFDKKSHQMLTEQMDKPGPMPQKIAEGVVGLTYMLFQQSNKTLPPQIMAPLTTVLVLKAFDFLQKSNDPEATPQVLGDAIDTALRIMASKFSVPEGNIAAFSKQMQSKVGAAQVGLLQSGGA